MNNPETSFFDIQDENYPGLMYLASPYTHAYPEVMELRYRLAMRAVKEFTMKGCTVLSPIVHYHPIATGFHMPSDFDFWETHNLRMLKSCSAMKVLQIPGHLGSKGIKAEVIAARGLQIPIEYVTLNVNVYLKFEMAWA